VSWSPPWPWSCSRSDARGQGVALARHRLAAADLARGFPVRPLAALGVS
jgi:hypothetical protein